VIKRTWQNFQRETNFVKNFCKNFCKNSCKLISKLISNPIRKLIRKLTSARKFSEKIPKKILKNPKNFLYKNRAEKNFFFKKFEIFSIFLYNIYRK